MRRLSDILPDVAARLGLDEELRLSRAMASWERLVAELIPAASGTSRLIEIRRPALVVSATDSMSAQELRLRSGELLEAFAMAPGGTRLLELRVIVRPNRQTDGGDPAGPGKLGRNG